MFIAHGSFFREHARWILGGILLLLIPSFVALFTRGGGGSDRRETDLPTLAGKPVDAVEFEAARQSIRDMNVVNYGQRIALTPQQEDRLKQDAMIRILMLREARALGLRAAEGAVEQYVRRQPVFADENGQFHPEKYRRYLIYLNNQGITAARFDQLMSEQYLLGQVEYTIASTAKVTPQQVELHYAPLNEPMTIEVVRFDVADEKQTPAIADADAQAYYDKNKEEFRQPARVKVRYARFGFDDVKKLIPVTDAEIKDYFERNKEAYTNGFDAAQKDIREVLAALGAQRKAGELAEQFTLKLVPDPNAPKPEKPVRPDFTKLATEAGAKVGETGYFSQNETIEGVAAGRALRQAAFALSYRPDPPYTDPQPGEDGYYVLEYLDGKPTRIADFAEVKTNVVATLQQQRKLEAVQQRGRTALDQVRKLVSTNKTFAAACAELKLLTEVHGPFTLSNNKLDITGAASVQDATVGMAVNAISEFIPTATGGLFFQLKDRQAPDRAEFEKNKAEFTARLLQRERRAIFDTWLNLRWREAQVNLGKLHGRQPAATETEEEPAEPQPVPAPAPAKG